MLLTLKTTQGYLKEAEDVFQHCSSLTKDVRHVLAKLKDLYVSVSKVSIGN